MGLGKTVQALAHILAEKQAGRLNQAVSDRLPDQPRADLAQRGPQVRARPRPSLSCTATNVASCSTKSTQHDVVLTSYALLLRDKDLLLEHTITGMVVLDEAQAIKNPATKLARTAYQLKSPIIASRFPVRRWKTIWASFGRCINFLMPGFLGDRETFRRVFRNLIEKEGDTRAPTIARRHAYVPSFCAARRSRSLPSCRRSRR